MARPDQADKFQIFRVQDPDLQGFLGGEQKELQYFSFDGLTNQFDQLQAQAQKLMDAEKDKGEDAEKLRTPFQKDLMHLYESVFLYTRLKNSLEPEGSSDFREELKVYQEAIGLGRAKSWLKWRITREGQ